jgi:ComF family protein
MSSILVSDIRLVFHSLLDFIYPPRCFGCDKDIDQGLVCNNCFTKLTTTALGVCPVCGLPKADNEECLHPLITGGITSITLTRIRALGTYTTPYKGLVRNFKYNRKTKLAKILGMGLNNLITSDPILSRADYLAPIPLHPARLRERGFNQSLLLAEQTSANSGFKLFDCLHRIENTKSQTQFNYKSRISNIRGAFEIKPNFRPMLKNKRVILVDDVITTGATLTEAAKVLIINGASEVYGIVVATAKV